MDKNKICFGIFVVIIAGGFFHFLLFPVIMLELELQTACQELAQAQNTILKNIYYSQKACVLTFCDEEEVTINNYTFVDNCREEVWRLKE